MTETYDVLIVGAGPVGLVLALILAENGISFKIIDKREHWSEESKALTITPKTLEALGLVGVADKFVQHGIPSRYINFYNYKRKKISHLDFSNIASPYPFILELPQNITTKILVDALLKKGVTVYRPIAIEYINSSKEGYSTCTLYNKHANIRYNVKARYIIGCDGAGSKVRELMNDKFVGGNAAEAFIMADIKLKNHPFHNERYMYYLYKKSSLYVMPMDREYYRLISTTDKPVTDINDDHVLHRFRQIFTDLGFNDIQFGEHLWISTFNPRQYIVDNYIKEKIILAGDAAHIQSPVGSQGLNTGIQDAVNLGWKLSFVLRSLLPPLVLNSYHNERRQVALNLFNYNDKLSKSVFGSKRLSRECSINKRYLLNIPYYQEKEKRVVSQLHITYPPTIILKDVIKGAVPGESFSKRSGLIPGHRFPFFTIFQHSIELSSYSLLSINKYTLFVFSHTSVATQTIAHDIDKEMINVVNITFSTGPISDVNAYFTQQKNLLLNDYTVCCLVRPDGYIENVSIIKDK